MKPLFTSAQWSLIDLSNQYGLDKKPFEERIEWAKSLLPEIHKCEGLLDLGSAFEETIENASEPELFTAALLNVWDICRGVPTGHYIELDSAASGCQLMSVATRCVTGMRNTGAIGDDVPDLYTTIFKLMKAEAPELTIISRSAVKKATVPYMYGSSKAPITVFGDMYKLFTDCYYKAVPRAEVIKNLLIGAWDENADFYEWELPDGHTAHIKVITEDKEVMHFNGQPFTYIYKKIGTKKKGELGTKALSARVIHSLDAYVLREVNARNDYNKEQLLLAKEAIETYLKGESQVGTIVELKRLEAISARFKMVSIAGASFIKRGYLADISKDYLMDLLLIINSVLPSQSHKLKLIHDGFGALANHVNTMKSHYNNVLVSIYRGVWLFEIVKQLTGMDCSQHIDPIDPAIVEQLRNSKYAIS